MENKGYTPGSPNNPFKEGDIVIYRNNPLTKYEVDHVERNRVFVVGKPFPSGKKRLVDLNAVDLMLYSDWQRIYSSKDKPDDKIRFTAKREYGTINVSGNPVAMKGRWVVRDEEGNYVAHSAWSNDLRATYEDETSTIEFKE